MSNEMVNHINNEEYELDKLRTAKAFEDYLLHPKNGNFGIIDWPIDLEYKEFKVITSSIDVKSNYIKEKRWDVITRMTELLYLNFRKKIEDIYPETKHLYSGLLNISYKDIEDRTEFVVTLAIPN